MPKKGFYMMAHRTGSGKRERRTKGKNNKPKIYLSVEIFLLFLLVFLISFAKIKLVTVISALVAIFLILISCLPRYKRMMARQADHKVYNHTQQ